MNDVWWQQTPEMQEAYESLINLLPTSVDTEEVSVHISFLVGLAVGTALRARDE